MTLLPAAGHLKEGGGKDDIVMLWYGYPQADKERKKITGVTSGLWHPQEDGWDGGVMGAQTLRAWRRGARQGRVVVERLWDAVIDPDVGGRWWWGGVALRDGV